MGNYTSSFSNGAAVDALLTAIKNLTTDNATTSTEINLSNYKVKGLSRFNFIGNSGYNTIDPTVNTCVVWGGDSSYPNKIGAQTKPAGLDYTPTGWADDTGYILEAATARVASILGGYDHVNNQIAGTICGGGHNFIKYNLNGHSFIGGGGYNVVGGGQSCIVSGAHCTIPSGIGCFIGVGKAHEVTGNYSNVVGGDTNKVTGNCSHISGGLTQTVTGDYTNISGGDRNAITSSYASISGGSRNSIAGNFSNIAGGLLNTIPIGTQSSILGGESNSINGTYSNISGGKSNTVLAQYCAILGGLSCTASASYSLVFGRRAKARQAGTVALSDDQDADFEVNTTRMFGARYENGYKFVGGGGCFGGDPVVTAALAVTSTTKGLLPPRMTTEQRDAITTPAEGLQIYNLTTHKINFYNGTAWEAVTSA